MLSTKDGATGRILSRHTFDRWQKRAKGFLLSPKFLVSDLEQTEMDIEHLLSRQRLRLER